MSKKRSIILLLIFSVFLQSCILYYVEQVVTSVEITNVKNDGWISYNVLVENNLNYPVIGYVTFYVKCDSREKYYRTEGFSIVGANDTVIRKGVMNIGYYNEILYVSIVRQHFEYK